MEPVLHQAPVEWVSHALFFLTWKVIYFSKMLMCLSLENRPVNLSFTHGVIRVVVLTWGPCSLMASHGPLFSHPSLTPREISGVWSPCSSVHIWIRPPLCHQVVSPTNPHCWDAILSPTYSSLSFFRGFSSWFTVTHCRSYFSFS